MLKINEWIIAEAAKTEKVEAESKNDDNDPDDPDDGQLTLDVGDELSLPKETPIRPSNRKIKPSSSKKSPQSADESPPSHKGKLILDATLPLPTLNIQQISDY